MSSSSPSEPRLDVAELEQAEEIERAPAERALGEQRGKRCEGAELAS